MEIDPSSKAENVPFLKSLRGRLLIQFLGFTIIPILILGGFAFYNARLTLTERTASQLNAIVDLKQDQLNNWIRDRRADASILANNPLNRDHIAVFLDASADYDTRILYKNFTIENFKSFQSERRGYLEIFFIDPQGNILLSTDPQKIYAQYDNPDLIANTIAAAFGEYTQDIYLDPRTNNHEMAFSRIVYRLDEEINEDVSPILGILVIRVSMEASLYPILKEGTYIGETGEALITRTEADQILILNPIKTSPTAPLKLSTPFGSDTAGASKLALNGFEGFGVFQDYRNETVLAAYRNISEIQWGLIIKQDLAEAYSPLFRISISLISALTTAVLISIYASYTQAKKTSEPLTNLVKAASEIAKGNYQTDIKPAKAGEFRALTNAFESMTKAILNRDAHLRSHTAEVETLFALSQEFTGVTDRAKILELALEYCQIMLKNDYCMIFLQNEGPNPMVGLTSPFWAKTFNGNTQAIYDYGYNIAVPSAIAKKTPLRTDNLQDDPRFSSQNLNPKNIQLTGITVPMLVGNKAVGAFWILSKSKDDQSKDEEHLNLVSLVANQTAVALERAGLVQDLIESYDRTLDALATALDARDKETEGHSRRVVAYTLAIANELGVPEEQLPTIQRGALLHDIGKIGVPDAILHKPGKLTQEEFEIIKTHPAVGKQILEGIPQLEDAAEIVYTHHERWQGQGYPVGLKGLDIPLGSRIFGIADTFDAITSDRPYRLALSYEYAVKEISDGKGTQFDPEIVEAFLRIPKNAWDNIAQDTLSKINEPGSSLVLPDPLIAGHI